MKEAYINKDLNVEIRDVPMPTAGPGELLIRTVVSGTNHKDWKMPKLVGGDPANHGDDIAGYIEAVGEGVTGFRLGDRNPVTAPTPLVVNGAATAVGAFAIKFATLSNIHPIIAIAGKGIPFVESLLNKGKGDIVIDYRRGAAYVNEKLCRAAEGHVISYAYDTISDKASLEILSKVVSAENGKIMSVVPKEDEVIDGITVLGSNAGLIHAPAKEGGAKVGDAEFGVTVYNLISLGLADGWFSGHPYEVAKGGLDGLEGVLKDLEAGKASAKKYVLRLAETPGVFGK